MGGFPSAHLSEIPAGLPLQEMLSSNPALRPTLSTLISTPYFNDVLTRTLTYIEHLLEKDDQSKAEFFRKFGSAIPQFSKKILKDKVCVLVDESSPSFLLDTSDLYG
jgi:SCY1-like protein 2